MEKQMISLVPQARFEEDRILLRGFVGTLPGKTTQGKNVAAFERAIELYTGRKHAVMVNSGSSANLLAVYALLTEGIISQGDNIGVPTLSWSTTVAPLIQFGLRPEAIEIDQNLSIACPAKNTVYVNPLGFMREHAPVLIEDNCESFGTKYRGRASGSGGLISTLSFYASHQMSTIEGGMILTDEKNIYETCLMLRSHGWRRDIPGYKQEFTEDFTFYVPGFNVRSNEAFAYIGLRRLENVDTIAKIREKNFYIYDNFVKNDYWKMNVNSSEYDQLSAFAYPVVHPNREQIVRCLQANGIECRPIIAGSILRQPFYKKLANKEPTSYENDFSYDVDRYGFYVPCHEEMDGRDVETVAKIINAGVSSWT